MGWRVPSGAMANDLEMGGEGRFKVDAWHSIPRQVGEHVKPCSYPENRHLVFHGNAISLSVQSKGITRLDQSGHSKSQSMITITFSSETPRIGV